jgi:hypothetical protein
MAESSAVIVRIDDLLHLTDKAGYTPCGTAPDWALNEPREVAMIGSKRIGWKTHEFGSGTHRFLGDHGPPGALPIRFELDLRIDSLRDFANPLMDPAISGVMQCEGTFSAEGLVQDAPCAGTLEMRLITERILRYSLSFDSDDGSSYRFIGEKPDLRLRNLYRTLFTCHGVIFDAAGKEISRSTVFFYRGTPDFTFSQRLTLGEGRSR